MSIYCRFGWKRDRYFKIRLDRFVNNRCDRILAMHSTAFDVNTSNSGILTQIHSSCISSIVDHSKTRRNNHKECRKEGTRTFRIEHNEPATAVIEGPNNSFLSNNAAALFWQFTPINLHTLCLFTVERCQRRRCKERAWGGQSRQYR